MADSIYFAPIRTSVIDPRTGLMSREWYLFFQALWRRTGGVDGTTTDDLAPNSIESIGAADLQALQLSGDQSLAQLPPQVSVSPDDQLSDLSSVKDQLAEVLKQLQDIKLAVNTGN